MTEPDASDQLIEPLLSAGVRSRALDAAAAHLRLLRDDPYAGTAWSLSDEQIVEIATAVLGSAWSVLTVTDALSQAATSMTPADAAQLIPATSRPVAQTGSAASAVGTAA